MIQSDTEIALLYLTLFVRWMLYGHCANKPGTQYYPHVAHYDEIVVSDPTAIDNRQRYTTEKVRQLRFLEFGTPHRDQRQEGKQAEPDGDIEIGSDDSHDDKQQGDME